MTALAQRLFFRPTRSQAVVERTAFNVTFFQPLLQRFGLALNRDHAGEAGVVVLLNPRCPSAVFRRIRAVYIDAINRMMRRWFSAYVLQKVFVDMPSLDNVNPACSIMFEQSMIGVATPAHHRCPATIFSRFFPVRAFPVPFRLGAAQHAHFSTVASARFGFSFAEQHCKNRARGAAIAKTNPRRGFAFIGWRLCSEFAEALIRQVESIHVWCFRTNRLLSKHKKKGQHGR